MWTVSPYQATTLGLLEAEGHVDTVARLGPNDERVCGHEWRVSQQSGPRYLLPWAAGVVRHTLLLLEAILPTDARLQQQPLRLVFRLDDDLWLSARRVLDLQVARQSQHRGVADRLRAEARLIARRAAMDRRGRGTAGRRRTGTKAAAQKPVPRSNQSLFRSS